MKGLPNATIVNITILGPDYSGFLQQMPIPSPTTKAQAWLLVSRICSNKTPPVVMLLPLESIPKVDIDWRRLTRPSLYEWSCPWEGLNMVDNLAGSFRALVEEFDLRSTYSDIVPKELHHRFDTFLSNLEKSWFGPWECILLGELQNLNEFDSILGQVANDVEQKCNIIINEHILRLFLAGKKGSRSHLQLSKECYIAGVGYESAIVPIEAKWLERRNASELLREAYNKLHEKDVDRKAVILVLDIEVQVLTWESLPSLRCEEIYRMPVSSIYASSNSRHHEQINLLDAYYILSPEEELECDTRNIWNYFKELNLKGIAGRIPSLDKWQKAFQKHNLFIYVGHGDGGNITPSYCIKELEKSPAAILMGCESITPVLAGSYSPWYESTQYLLVGSPFVIGNLWAITVEDAETLLKTIFEIMLKQNGSVSTIGTVMRDLRRNLPLMQGARTVSMGLPTTVTCQRKRKNVWSSNYRNKRRKV